MELNGVTNVAVREGSLFDPVEGERFDLIVANPPFVISPSRRYLFRDNELIVDELCRQLVRSAPSHLTDGGHCQVLASWAHVRGQDWRDRLHGWFEGTGCDALVIEREMLEPGAHAASWLRQTESPERWTPEYDSWMDYYEQHDVEAVGFGLITMRKRAAGTPWFRAEEAPQDWAMPCGDHLGAIFELADFLDFTPDRQLLDVALQVAPDVVLDERARPATEGGEGGASDGWTVTDRVLRQTAGLCWEGQIDANVAAIAAACDGTRPLGAVLADAAGIADVDPPDLARAALPAVASARRTRLPPAGVRLIWPDGESDLLARLDVETGRDRRSDFAGRGLRGEGDLDLAVVQRELLDRGLALVAGVLITGDHDVGQFVLQELSSTAPLPTVRAPDSSADLMCVPVAHERNSLGDALLILDTKWKSWNAALPAPPPPDRHRRNRRSG